MSTTQKTQEEARCKTTLHGACIGILHTALSQLARHIVTVVSAGADSEHGHHLREHLRVPMAAHQGQVRCDVAAMAGKRAKTSSLTPHDGRDREEAETSV